MLKSASDDDDESEKEEAAGAPPPAPAPAAAASKGRGKGNKPAQARGKGHGGGKGTPAAAHLLTHSLELPCRCLAEEPLTHGLHYYPWRAVECLGQLLTAAVQMAAGKGYGEERKARAHRLGGLCVPPWLCECWMPRRGCMVPLTRVKV